MPRFKITVELELNEDTSDPYGWVKQALEDMLDSDEKVVAFEREFLDDAKKDLTEG